MEKYLLDTNIYIGFYDRYYLPAHFPTFWENFKAHINDFVVIPKVVLDENYQDTWLRSWIKENFVHDVIDHRDFVEEFAEILAHIQKQEHYKDDVLINWAREKIADPWILAIAKKENLIIVTDETSNPNLNKNQPSKNAKIPDIARELGIECINRNEFFARIDLVV